MSIAIHAFGDDALGDHDAVALAELIRTGQVGRREVIEAAIVRAEKIQPELNAVQVADFERALTTAARPGNTGPFDGVPTFIKDNTDVAGLPSGQGSSAFRAKPAKHDAPITGQLRGLGLVLLGKSTLPEFGFNATTEYMDLPPTRNPWNPAYSSGASSGGAAALVASGVVPIAHANDGGGSIRIPAACCGLVGLKPTRGRFRPNPLERVLPVNIVCEGVVTRSVRDTAQVFAGTEVDWRPKRLPPIGLVEGPNTRRLRVGLFLDSVTGTPTDDETRAAVTAAGELLARMGHEVAPIQAPVTEQFAEDFENYWGLLAFALSTSGRGLFGSSFDRSALDGLTVGLAARYRRNWRHTPGLVHRLRRSHVAYTRIFDTCDVVLSPVVGHTTPEIGHLSPTQPFEQLMERLIRFVSFTPLNNASGGPAISLPTSLSAAGLPIGVHLAARPGAERTLLELAFEIEAAAPWPRIAAI